MLNAAILNTDNEELAEATMALCGSQLLLLLLLPLNYDYYYYYYYYYYY